ncbi:MAG: hypothetical protein EYC69_07825 [Bacteroidetes bacterium]|nr:MAG: hypothetical protein EYC69_07825 [Bacteroidota bacterium]
MNLKSWTKDSFLLGLIGGAISLYLFFLIVSQIRLFIVSSMNNPYLFGSPRSQLIAVGLNLICFRILMINMEREKTGKGLLFVTVLAVFSYYIYYYIMNH